MQDALFLDLGDVAGKMSRFWILLMLSAIIATAGILLVQRRPRHERRLERGERRLGAQRRGGRARDRVP